MGKDEMVKQLKEVPGPISEALLERKQNIIARGVSNSTPIFVEKAEGASITDVDGNTYIDFYGGIGTLNVGHCLPSVVEAIKNQVDKLMHTCFMVTMYEPYVELAEKLAEITPGNFAKKAMFVNSGAETVENAVKIARAYKKRPGILSFECAFHGRTMMTMSLTSKVIPYKYGFGPFAPETYKIPSAYCYRCAYKSTYPECGLHCLEQFDRFFTAEVPAENLAAMIIEPVQGEGGFIVPPKEFLPGLREICDKNDMLMITDEVQTGFARTGKLFAIEHWGVEPDIMTLAKSIGAGIPLGAVIGKAEVMDAPAPGHIGGTYGGNPIACAASLATIDHIVNEDLAAKARAIEAIAKPRLLEMKDKYPMIGDVRGIGAMLAIELVKDRKTKEPAKAETVQVFQECYKRGLIAMTAGIFSNVVRMLPPLVISEEQLRAGLDIFEDAVAAVNSRM